MWNLSDCLPADLPLFKHSVLTVLGRFSLSLEPIKEVSWSETNKLRSSFYKTTLAFRATLKLMNLWFALQYLEMQVFLSVFFFFFFLQFNLIL